MFRRQNISPVRAATLIAMLGAANPMPAAGLQRHQATQRHMGTPFHIVLYSADETTANRAFRRAFSRIAELDRRLSNYRSDSELNQLCRTSPHSKPQVVSQDLWIVLRAADELSQVTDGAFDVTIGPITKQWRRARRRKVLPDAAPLHDALDRVDYRLIAYEPTKRQIMLQRGGMQLDLGGIAKGYAVDAALAEIRAAGIERALVNGGGDLAVGEAPPGELGWPLKIARLNHDSPDPRQLRLAGGAVATSGDAWQFVEIDGVRYSHIVDPRTGLGVTERSSVTVIAPNCMQADAWASALSVLGPSGLKHCEQRPGMEALVTVAREGKLVESQTSGFAKLFLVP